MPRCLWKSADNLGRWFSSSTLFDAGSLCCTSSVSGTLTGSRVPSKSAVCVSHLPSRDALALQTLGVLHPGFHVNSEALNSDPQVCSASAAHWAVFSALDPLLILHSPLKSYLHPEWLGDATIKMISSLSDFKQQRHNSHLCCMSHHELIGTESQNPHLKVSVNSYEKNAGQLNPNFECFQLRKQDTYLFVLFLLNWLPAITCSYLNSRRPEMWQLDHLSGRRKDRNIG